MGFIKKNSPISKQRKTKRDLYIIELDSVQYYL